MLSDWIDKTIKGFNYLFLPFEFPKFFGQILDWTFTQRSLPRELIHWKTHKNWFQSRGFKTIIDLGANAGPFSFAARAFLPDAQIYAFEPLPDCYERLVKNLTPFGNFTAFQSAIGDQSGQMEMWKSEFSESSSILAMGELHKKNFPHTANTQAVPVPISRLDDYINKMDLVPPILLKIDVQGYEDKVIKGAVNTLKNIDWVMIEMSFRPLYEGQPLFDNIYRSLITSGFKFAGNMEALYSPLDGSILQSDGIFYR
jgi:FkbM family methyltransferase